MKRLLGAGLLLTAAFGAATLAAADSNARWDFLRMNLQVFPGTEKIFQPDDLLFWKLRPNLQEVPASEKLPDAEHAFRVSTDAEGRRRTPAGAEGAKTMLFLGDSCTFGIPVNDAEAFPARVGEALGVRAINAGVPGYSAFQGRLVLEQALAAGERPDVVVITFWVNGRTVWDHLSDAEHSELMAAERAGEMSRHRVTRLLRRVLPEGRPRLTEEEFGSEIRAMVEAARKAGAVPVLVVWPSAVQMDGGMEHPRQTLLRTIGRETGTVVAEPLEAFRAAGGARLFVDPVHATAEGYEVAARAVAAALAKLP
ncbi:MAG: hypothetical protein GC160_18700 [Acidobacteria bacterium]|nr:hypothetical protein [Acidobacteriota bacterium]